jgi:hypothetical protein
MEMEKSRERRDSGRVTALKQMVDQISTSFETRIWAVNTDGGLP